MKIERLNKSIFYNYMKIERGIFKHKQIENRDGQTFLRMKQRPVIIVTPIAN